MWTWIIISDNWGSNVPDNRSPESLSDYEDRYFPESADGADQNSYGFREYNIDPELWKFLAALENHDQVLKIIESQIGTEIKQSESNTRRVVTICIVAFFLVMNIFVFYMIMDMYYTDMAFLKTISTDKTVSPELLKGLKWSDRTVNATVVAAVIAATTAQLGAVTYAIAVYFFPQSK